MRVLRSAPPICIAIFASRERSDTLYQTVKAAAQAAPAQSVIDVLVNGNAALADVTATRFKAVDNVESARIRVWHIPIGDKANAWNQHIHRIWDGHALVFYTDGYVQLDGHSLASLIDMMENSPHALGGTGVPSVGGSWKLLRDQMLAAGGFHGNLCCARGSTLAAFKQRQIHLPLGLYRTDSLMGAILSFGLDSSRFLWSPQHFIAVDPHATWRTEAKHWWNYRHVTSAIKRMRRQAKGRIENQAIKSYLAGLKILPEDLPKTITAVIAAWEASFPRDSERFVGRNPLLRQAMRELRVEKHWSDRDLTPVLL